MATSTSSKGSSEDPLLKEKIHKVLKTKKIKLWLSPYVENSEISLQNLIQEWKGDASVPSELTSDASNPRVLRLLQEFQAHSLQKYREKQERQIQSPTSVVTPRLVQSPACATNAAVAGIPSKVNLTIKILGFTGTIKDETEGLGFTDGIEEVVVDKKDAAGSNGRSPPVVLRLHGVSTQESPDDLVQYLRTILDVPQVRIIYRGKTISSVAGSQTGEKKDQKTSSQAGSSAAGDPPLTLGGALFASDYSAPVDNKEVALLCIASSSSSDDPRASKHADLHARITAIRDAALQIRDTTNLEITDQRGSTVPMAKEDRLAFLTALALHRLGRHSVEPEEAIVFLLEADSEWSMHPHLRAWADRVDNYGLLQLDICWAYLQLESLSNLPDSLRRLEEAERVLRKQVNVNFVTLALAQADLGNSNEVGCHCIMMMTHHMGALHFC